MHYWPLNRISTLWLMLLLSLNAQLHAQETAFVQLSGDPEYTVTAGEETHIQLTFLINEGYHIQADQVKDENLIPSVLSFDTSAGLIIGDPIFPQAVELEVNGEEEAWLVYSDVLKINVPVRTVKGVEQGVLLIKGNLHYQACDDSKCYFPRDLGFSIKINVE